MKKIILFIFTSIILLGLAGCVQGGFTPTGTIELEEIESIYVGEEIKLNVTLTNLEGEVVFEREKRLFLWSLNYGGFRISN